MIDYSKADLTGMVFVAQSLQGSTFAYSNLTNVMFAGADLRRANFSCTYGAGINFNGADVTYTKFERATETVLQSLVGAVWRDKLIGAVSGWIIEPTFNQDGSYHSGYHVFCTDVFVQCGCMQRTLEEWEDICQNEETIKALHTDEPSVDLAMALQWWKDNVPTIRACVAQLTSEA